MTSTNRPLRAPARTLEISVAHGPRAGFNFRPKHFCLTPIATAMHALAATPIVTDKPAEPPAPATPGSHFAGLLGRQDAAAEPEAWPDGAADDSPDEQDEDEGSRAASTAKRLLRRVVGKRFIQAREFNAITQTDAAKALGYRNSAQLSQWEQCKRLPPLHMVIQAAQEYGTSVDFLVGVSDEPLRDPALGLRAATMRGIRGMVNGLAESLVASIANHAALVGPDAVCSRAVLAAGQQLIEALCVVQRDPALRRSAGVGARGSPCGRVRAAPARCGDSHPALR